MKLSKLIELLEQVSATMPHEDPEVRLVNYDGCEECNYDAMPQYHEACCVNTQTDDWGSANPIVVIG